MSTTIEHSAHEELLEKCAIILRQSGWIVERADNFKMETPGEIQKRLGINRGQMHYRIHSFKGQFLCRRGDSGRIRQVHVTPELEAHLKHEPNNQGQKPSGICVNVGSCGNADC